MAVGGLRCTSEEQIKEQAYQSHSTACVTFVLRDNENGIHEEGQISPSFAETTEAAISALAHGTWNHNTES